MQIESILVAGAAIYAVVVAMLLGSFINLAADRVPRGESVIRPRSHCRSCGRVLNLLDLVPVGGYIVRRGSCATCGAKIGISSPVVEAACGAAMLGAIAVWGLFPGIAAGLAAVGALGAAWVLLNLARPKARREARSG